MPDERAIQPKRASAGQGKPRAAGTDKETRRRGDKESGVPFSLSPCPLVSQSSSGRPIALAIGIFCALSLAAAITSPGFLEGDACTHYLYARYALSEPHLLTNVWGRPFCTAIYCVPAVLAGRLGVRVASMLLAVGTALVTWRIAKGQGYRRPGLALIFVLAQPLVFLHSFSELTELPFAFLLALTFWAYQRRNWAAFALVAGLLPTCRPEGFGFLILAAVALLLHNRPRWLPLLALPLLLWSIAGWALVDHEQPWLRGIVFWIPSHWPYAADSVYEPGPLLFFRHTAERTDFSFFASLPAIVSPIVFPASLIGVWLALRGSGFGVQAEGSGFARSGSGAEIPLNPEPRTLNPFLNPLIALIPLFILATHSYLYWRGKMASSGELRYMLTAAPFWGLLSARGWEWIFDRCRLRRIYLWAGVAALLPIFANVAWRCVPIKHPADWVRAEQVSRWYRTTPLRKDHPRLMASHIGIHYFSDTSVTDQTRTVEWHRKNIVAPPDGTILIWEGMYGFYNSDRDRSITLDEIKAAGWIPYQTFRSETHAAGDSAIARMAGQITKDDVGTWYVFLSPKDISSTPALPRSPSPP